MGRLTEELAKKLLESTKVEYLRRCVRWQLGVKDAKMSDQEVAELIIQQPTSAAQEMRNWIDQWEEEEE